MRYLLAASLLWAFSFGLIKTRLAGVDPVAVSAARLLLAAVIFLPFLIRAPRDRRAAAAALGLGALQFGLMYMLYIASFAWLPAWLVALFTVFTPLYVALGLDLLDRRFQPRNLGAVLLAVAGAGVVVWRGLPEGADWRGIGLLQGANLCFAAGQIIYARSGLWHRWSDSGRLAWMYVGAALVSVAVLTVQGRPGLAGWTAPALWSVLYLGLVPTALGFYLWNKGAARTAGGRLAVANNLKIPLAVLVSWLVFRETADPVRVLAGLSLVTAGLFAAGRSLPQKTS